jgi:hypothetical protein
VPSALDTYPMSINASMTVTGYYYISPTTTDGFVREADGAITTFSVRDGVWTEPESINAAGDVTGFFELVAGVPQGFERYADGRIVTFDPACVFCIPSPQAQPVAINNSGEIAGNYPFPLSASQGFRRSPGAVFSQVGLAGDSLGAAYAAIVTGLNGSGTVVGYVPFYSESFISHPDGFTAWFSVPVAEDPDCVSATIADSVNSDGFVTGWYSAESSPFPTHRCETKLGGGFVRSPQGVFTLFNPPGTLVTLPQWPGEFIAPAPAISAPHRLSINQEGSITGSYTDTEGAQHGFVRNPFGTITSFDPPRGGQTLATSINDSGVIVGSYFYDWNTQIAQGFLRVPHP